jgi:hypothetical protein
MKTTLKHALPDGAVIGPRLKLLKAMQSVSPEWRLVWWAPSLTEARQPAAKKLRS